MRRSVPSHYHLFQYLTIRQQLNISQIISKVFFGKCFISEIANFNDLSAVLFSVQLKASVYAAARSVYKSGVGQGFDNDVGKRYRFAFLVCHHSGYFVGKFFGGFFLNNNQIVGLQNISKSRVWKNGFQQLFHRHFLRIHRHAQFVFHHFVVIQNAVAALLLYLRENFFYRLDFCRKGYDFVLGIEDCAKYN